MPLQGSLFYIPVRPHSCFPPHSQGVNSAVFYDVYYSGRSPGSGLLPGRSPPWSGSPGQTEILKYYLGGVGRGEENKRIDSTSWVVLSVGEWFQGRLKLPAGQGRAGASIRARQPAGEFGPRCLGGGVPPDLGC
jgi:hypothetical protein